MQLSIYKQVFFKSRAIVKMLVEEAGVQRRNYDEF